MNNATLINQNSSDVEYYTDRRFIEAARYLMRGIDLDPASSAKANDVVKAERYFDISTDGINQAWRADSIWLNWPFGRREEPCVPGCLKKLKNPKHVCHDYLLHGNKAWCDKLFSEYDAGSFKQACIITYAATSEGWFQPLLEHPNCFLSPRTNYYLPDGSVKRGVTKGSCITYLGEKIKEFHHVFKEFGVIKVGLYAQARGSG